MCPVEVELQQAAGVKSAQGAGVRAVLMVPEKVLSAWCTMPPCDGTGRLLCGSVM